MAKINESELGGSATFQTRNHSVCAVRVGSFHVERFLHVTSTRKLSILYFQSSRWCICFLSDNVDN